MLETAFRLGCGGGELVVRSMTSLEVIFLYRLDEQLALLVLENPITGFNKVVSVVECKCVVAAATQGKAPKPLARISGLILHIRWLTLVVDQRMRPCWFRLYACGVNITKPQVLDIIDIEPLSKDDAIRVKDIKFIRI